MAKGFVMKTDTVPDWWETAQREDFSATCCDYFHTNFNDADTFIVRAEYIKTRGRPSHQLRQHVAVTPAETQRRRRLTQIKDAGVRMSTRAMRSGGSLIH
jgi:hypothetical protein